MRAAVVAEVAARDPRANELLDAQARRLAGHAGLSEGLRRKSAFVVELAESIRLFSLNAILAAHRVRDAAAIGAVAGLMKTRSDAAGPEILALADDIEAAAGLLEAASFRVAVGRVQAEALPGAPWVAEALAVTLDDVADTTVALDAALDALAAAVVRRRGAPEDAALPGAAGPDRGGAVQRHRTRARRCSRRSASRCARRARS